MMIDFNDINSLFPRLHLKLKSFPPQVHFHSDNSDVVIWLQNIGCCQYIFFPFPPDRYSFVDFGPFSQLSINLNFIFFNFPKMMLSCFYFFGNRFGKRRISSVGTKVFTIGVHYGDLNFSLMEGLKHGVGYFENSFIVTNCKIDLILRLNKNYSC